MREGSQVKTVLATVLILVLGVTGIALWKAGHAQRAAVSSSQIFVHGTPVCVMQHAGQIIASVGMCGSLRGESREDDYGNGRFFRGENPSAREPGFELPPGHPPVDSAPSFGKGRGTLI